MKAAAEKMLMAAERSMAQALEAYGKYLVEKGNKPSSQKTTMAHLRAFFGEKVLAGRLVDLTPTRAEKRYEELRPRYAVDSHRNMLAEAKTFLGWCVAKPQRWMRANPLADVKGIGKRKHGKEQLRVDEARVWCEKALALAEGGDAGAVAALCTVILGMRAGEIVSRQVRDLDDNGRLLWIPASKTEAGRRTLEVPEEKVDEQGQRHGFPLRRLLLRLAKDKQPLELLFGVHWRDWPRLQVQRICAIAKVPEVTAHGMRGLHSTLATRAGMTGHAVAGQLGHSSPSVAQQSYIAVGEVEDAARRVGLRVLEGGRK